MVFQINVSIPPGITKLNENVQSGFSKGIQDLTARMTRAAQQNAPYKVGNLRRSIISPVSQLGGLKGTIIQDTGVAKYGQFVHDGTGIYHQPDPHKKWVVSGATARKYFAKDLPEGVKFVWIKGMKARPYMKEAFDQKKDEAKPIIEEWIRREVGL